MIWTEKGKDVPLRCWISFQSLGVSGRFSLFFHAVPHLLPIVEGQLSLQLLEREPGPCWASSEETENSHQILNNFLSFQSFFFCFLTLTSQDSLNFCNKSLNVPSRVSSVCFLALSSVFYVIKLPRCVCKSQHNKPAVTHKRTGVPDMLSGRFEHTKSNFAKTTYLMMT